MSDADDYAVALRYLPPGHPSGTGGLPKVTAKGRGAIAAQIRSIAAANGIPMERDADLVAILAKLDVGCPIPTVAFAAVAEILAHLYRANARAQAAPADGHLPAGKS